MSKLKFGGRGGCVFVAGSGFGLFGAGREFVTPREDLFLQATTSGLFPFGFRRKPLSGPSAIGIGVVPTDVVNRVLTVSFRNPAIFPVERLTVVRCFDKLRVVG